MRYSFPRLPGEFEIPDQWLSEAGMTGFVASGRRAYCSAETAVLVPLREVEPPFRYRVRNGFHRFYASVAAGFECLPTIIDGES